MTNLQLLEENLAKWLGHQYYLDDYDPDICEDECPEATHYVECADSAYDDTVYAIEESGWKILTESEFEGSDFDGVIFYIKEDAE